MQKSQSPPFSGQELHCLLATRLDRAGAVEPPATRAAGSEYRQLIGSVYDAAALFGVDELAQGCLELLDGRAGDLRALRQALPGPDAIEARLSRLRSAESASEPSAAIEHRVLVLSRDPAPGLGLHDLPDGRGNRVQVIDTPAAVASAVDARAGDHVVLLVDEANLPEDTISTLSRDLRPALQSGRLGMVLLVESLDVDPLRRAWRAGFAAVEPRGQQAAVLERCVQFVAARCRAAQSGGRVLLIDEDELARATCATLLTAAGIRVETLESMRDLPDVLEGDRPELVLISGNMDGLPGDEIAGMLELCAFDAEPGIAFLARAADSAPALERLHAAGFELLFPAHGAMRLVARVRRRTERNRLHALERSHMVQRDEERYRIRQALDQHALVSVTDRRGQIVHANRKFCAVSGYSAPELVGSNHRIINSGVHPPEFFREMWRTISRGEIWQGTICNRARDGSEYWVLSTIVPFVDRNGRPYRYVSIRTDVTGCVEAERAEARARKRLQLGQHYAGIGTWEWDIPTGELYWTDTIAPLFGLAKGELETSYDSFLAAIHPEDRQSVIDAVNACIEHDQPYAIEHRVVWPDGTERWLSEHGAVERSETGEPLRMIGVVQDIDERKRALMELVAARQQADRANQAKSEFLSRMSHELRTPMNAVLGFAQLIQADPGLPEEHVDNSAEIIKAGRHLLELINEVLDLSKIESGRIQISIEPVSVAPLVDECMSLVEEMAQRRSIWLKREVVPDLVVRADRTRLKQALLNLLSNAIKYNRPEGQVWLRADLHQTGDGATISVADTGPGIAADKLERLYEPFERLDAEMSDVEGTGIGLTITRKLVELMGGAIRVQTEPGQGSTFVIDLALADAPPRSGLGRGRRRSRSMERIAGLGHAAVYRGQPVQHPADGPGTCRPAAAQAADRAHRRIGD